MSDFLGVAFDKSRNSKFWYEHKKDYPFRVRTVGRPIKPELLKNARNAPHIVNDFIYVPFLTFEYWGFKTEKERGSFMAMFGGLKI